MKISICLQLALLLTVSTITLPTQAEKLLHAPTQLVAQKAYPEKEILAPIRVKFRRNSDSAIQRGSIQAFTVQPYYIRCQSQQLFRLEVAPEGVKASVYFMKDGSKSRLGSVSGGVWQERVPGTGDMVVEIVADEIGYSYTAQFIVR